MNNNRPYKPFLNTKFVRFSLCSGLVAALLLFLTYFASALTTVQISGGSTTTADNVDITTTHDLGVDSGIFSWRVNSNPLNLLYLPFNNAATQTDYSGSGNNMTTSGTVYSNNASGDCQVGGCLDFDGSAILNPITLGSLADEVTVSGWFKIESPAGGHNSLLGFGTGVSNCNGLDYYGTGDLFGFNTCGNDLYGVSGSGLNDGGWHHYVAFFDFVDRTNNRLFVDGTELTLSNVLNTPTQRAKSTQFGIGNNGWFAGERWNGKQDEVKIFNYHVTDTMAGRLFTDGGNNQGTPILIPDDSTTPGEIYQLLLYPEQSDGTIGSAVSSNSTSIPVTGPTTFTTSTVIGSNNQVYDNTAITCDGTAGGVELTIDGAHTFTSVSIENGCTLTHSDNTTTRTNFLDITTTGNFSIDGSSSIDVFEKGYSGGVGICVNGNGPGGGGGGGAADNLTGSGGTHGGQGGNGNSGASSSVFSGTTHEPIELGSGGGSGGEDGCSGGAASNAGDGGGAVKLTVGGTLQLDGDILANGGVGTSGLAGGTGVAGGGAGGSIWVDAATISGSGALRANGGNAPAAGSSPAGGGGGGGRIAVYYTTDNHNDLLNSLEAYGADAINNGAPGTVYIKPASDNFGDLYWDNNGLASQFRGQTNGVASFDTITITGGGGGLFADATLFLDETFTFGDGTNASTLSFSGTTMTTSATASMTIANNATLTHEPNTISKVNFIDITIPDLTIDSGGGINVDEKGFAGGVNECDAGNGPGASVGGTQLDGVESGGASHGGSGADGVTAGSQVTYGLIRTPTTMGSGAGAGGEGSCGGPGVATGGAGGGTVKLVVSDTLDIDGAISANGGNGFTNGSDNTGTSGGGAGGSIWIDTDTLTGSGTFSATGGVSLAQNGQGPGGAGGGGRIAIYYDTNTHSGLRSALSIHGGGGASLNDGSSGTIYIKADADSHGDLIMDNNDETGQHRTVVSTGESTSYNTIEISDGSFVFFDESTLFFEDSFDLGGASAETTFVFADTTTTSDLGALLTISDNGVLSHDINTTSKVNFLDVSVDDFTIDSGGKIDVTGKGYRGGVNECDPGDGPGGGTASAQVDNVTGGGGSHGGRGGNGTSGGSVAVFSGSVKEPADMGSGGSPGGEGSCSGGGVNPGGSGGGTIRLQITNTLTNNGEIISDGGGGTTNGVDNAGTGGGGAGGSIWINMTTLSGSGTFSADGGDAPAQNGQGTGGAGGGGRIALYYSTDAHTDLRNAVSTYGATDATNAGSSGTIFLKAASQAHGSLILDNNDVTSQFRGAITTSDTTSYNTVEVTGGANHFFDKSTLYFEETFTLGGVTVPAIFEFGGTTTTSGANSSFIINNLGVLTHENNTTTRSDFIDITTRDFTLNTGGQINLDEKGYTGGVGICVDGNGPGGGPAGNAADQRTGTGGTHGGRGGNGNVIISSSNFNGSISQPTELGSGGGSGGEDGCSGGAASFAGDGGGAIKVTTSNAFTFDGAITSNGGDGSTTNVGGTGQAGGGAGGSIWIDTQTLNGSGTIEANGGVGPPVGGSPGSGGGGGGRIAIYYTTNNHGTLVDSLETLGGDSTANDGGHGTIYLKDSSKTNGDLYLKNNDVFSQHRTDLPGLTSYASMTLTDAANVRFIESTLALDGTLLITGGATQNSRLDSTDTVLTGGLQSHLHIQDMGILSHDFNTTTRDNFIDFTFEDITIDSGGTVDVTERGYTGGVGICDPGDGPGGGGAGGAGDNLTGAGGTHGGRGSNGNSGTSSSNFNGSVTQPTELGSGGGSGGEDGCGGGAASNAGDGGGAIKLVANDAFIHNGTIVSNGGTGTSGLTGGTGVAGGGAGGSIWIEADTLSGNGILRANGGDAPAAGSSPAGGGGGGGRIAVYYDTNSHTNLLGSIETFGDPSLNTGGSGTAFIMDNALSSGSLLLNNNSNSAQFGTNLFLTGGPSQFVFIDLSVLNAAELVIDAPGTCSPNAVSVSGLIDQSGAGVITNNLSGSCNIGLTGFVVTTINLDPAGLGQAYSDTLMAAGGYAPVSWDCQGDPGCGSSLPTGLSLNGSTGVISGTPTVLGSFPFTIEATDSDPGGVQSDTQALTLTVGNIPSAPSALLAEDGTNPSNVIDQLPEFSAVFTDLDALDMGTQYQIQVDDNNDFSSVAWDSGLVNFTNACTNGARCEDIVFGGAALAYDGTQYFWRIRFADQIGLLSPWSEDPISTNSFTMYNPAAPDAPTNLKASNSTNPDVVSDPTPAFSFVVNDVDGAFDSIVSYRIQVDDNNDFSSIVWDSGSQMFSVACTVGATCSGVNFGGTPLDLDGATYFWRVQVIDSFGLMSPWSEDPVSTNFFTMFDVSSGTPRTTSGGGGGSGSSGSSGSSSASSSTSSSSPSGESGGDDGSDTGSLSPAADSTGESTAEEPETPTFPPNPAALVPYPLSSSTIRWYIDDKSDNELGFHILDEKGQIIKTVGKNTFYVDEVNLQSNTRYERRVIAYNAAGDSAASATASIYTFADAPDGLFLRYATMEDAQVSVSGIIEVENSTASSSSSWSRFFNDVFASEPEEIALSDIIQDYEGKTAYFFQNMMTGEVSGWIKESTYEFENLRPNTTYAIRVKTRNADGYQTNYSIPLNMQTLSSSMPVVEFQQFVGINQGLNGGPGSFDHDGDRVYLGDELTFLLEYCHVAGDAATNVVISNPIHPYFLYRQSTGGVFRDNLFQFDVGTIEPGTCGFVGYLIEISADTPEPGIILNQAALDALDLPGTVLSNVTANPLGNYVIIRRPPRPLPQPPRNAIHSSSRIGRGHSGAHGHSGGSHSSSYHHVSGYTRPQIPRFSPPQDQDIFVAYQARSAFGLIFVQLASNMNDVSNPSGTPDPGTLAEGPEGTGGDIPHPPAPDEFVDPITPIASPEREPEPEPDEPVSECGNAIVELGEQCDDGNTRSNDGCSDTCQIDEVIPDPELIVLNVTPATREHGFLVTYQVIGMTDGDTELRRKGVELEVLKRSTFVSHVENTFEIPVSLIRGRQSFDFSRIFHEISRMKNLSDFQYNRIFKKAIEESEYEFTLRAVEGEAQAEADLLITIDNIPPVTSIDVAEGEYFEPFNVNISTSE